MRQKKIETTMKVYVQVNNKDLEESVPNRWVKNIPNEAMGNVVPFRLTSQR